MRNTDILKMLNDNEIEKLKELLKNEIILEGVNLTSSKAGFKKIFTEIKKQRDILKYSKIEGGYQYYTNTFFCDKSSS